MCFLCKWLHLFNILWRALKRPAPEALKCSSKQVTVSYPSPKLSLHHWVPASWSFLPLSDQWSYFLSQFPNTFNAHLRLLQEGSKLSKWDLSYAEHYLREYEYCIFPIYGTVQCFVLGSLMVHWFIDVNQCLHLVIFPELAHPQNSGLLYLN